MANLINDGSLIGYWPLLEPSGAPLFENYSPAYALYPSGLSFDFHVAVANNSNSNNMMSVWPGGETFFDSASGVVRSGFKAQGHWELKSTPAPLSRYLVVGGGARKQAEQFLSVPVAQSGFTVGGWFYPSTDGYLNAADDANLTSWTWNTEYGRAHSLLAFSRQRQAGWFIGISGQKERGAQHDFTPEAGNQLTGYVTLNLPNNSFDDDTLTSPIEDGRYTHLAFSYRYIDGSSNQIVLYKDGRVAASGTTDHNLTLSNTDLVSSNFNRALTIGGSEDTDNLNNPLYDRTSGWGNLVSGVYFFRRVLNEGELLEMHERGGLQPHDGSSQQTSEVSINDVDIIGYYPFLEPGYGDASRLHNPLIANYDLGELTEGIIVPGPHGGGGALNDSTSNAFWSAAATSGLCNEILSNGSWTIGFHGAPQNADSRDGAMMFSWGSVTTITNASLLPISSPPTANTAGLCCTISGVTNEDRLILEVYSNGDVSDVNNTLIFNLDSTLEHFDNASYHVALAYDDSTRGVAAYVNGSLQSSGTLSSSLTNHLKALVGLGYPLIIGNGIQDDLADSSTKGLHNNGGTDTWIGPVFIAKRALVAPEIRAIALSGVQMSSLLRTPNDPRLVGYWPANDFKIDDIIVQDRAKSWNIFAGNLVRGDSFVKQERWYDRDNNEPAGSVYRNDGTAFYDQFAPRVLPLELNSYGNLGITSGVFVPCGGSAGLANVTDGLRARSSIANLASRYKACIEESDSDPQNAHSGFVLSYEVTPSGNIPATLMGIDSNNAGTFVFNSALHSFGDTTSQFRSYLTTIDEPAGSGVQIVFRGQSNTPLVSGTLSYGVPSRVLFHADFEQKYNVSEFSTGLAPYVVSLWIDGELVHRRLDTVGNVELSSDGAVDGASDYHILQFGGLVGTTSFATQMTNLDSGLGDIYLREIFLMKGAIPEDEVAALAASGIQTPSIQGFTNQQETTQVTIANSDLVAYYRFNGFAGGGSGTTDLSLNGNHLFGAQQSLAENGEGNDGSFDLRAFPGPFLNSDLGVQASGFTYSDILTGTTGADLMPPFMASGVGFNSPDSSFSVGFFYIRKNVPESSRFKTIVAYGAIPDSVGISDTDEYYGWAIGTDDTNNLKMVLSTNGNMYFDNVSNAAQAGQVVVGLLGEGGSIYEDLRFWQQFQDGHHRMARLDSWSHYCWVYDSDAKSLTCYFNGNLVDRKFIPNGLDPQIPAEYARYLTFLQHTRAPWEPGDFLTNDFEGSLTDFFYFTDPLTQEEVRYISQNGIDGAVGTPTSGIMGGYVRGQDTASGVFGGFYRGQDVGSGLIGGFIPGGSLASGIVGGYVSGVVFGEGTIGGFVRGLDSVSGVMAGYIHGLGIGSGMVAGYIRGQDVGSGHFGGLIFGSQVASGLLGGFLQASDLGSGSIGGFMLGGLQGRFEFDAGYTVEVLAAEDFDARLEVAKTASSDFDAKVVIFQNEQPPLVDIIVPDSTVVGLVPPFNQYFVGAASGTQGKTISLTRWTFGDLSPSQTVAESGVGYYPVQHMYAGSGFFIAKFEAVDSDGMHASATRIINVASGIDPVIISLSGVPRSGDAELVVDFSTNVNILPNGVSLSTQLLNFDDGQSTISFNPTHSYTQPGTYKPIWIVRDSRGIIWSDSLEAGNDFLENGGL